MTVSISSQNPTRAVATDTSSDAEVATNKLERYISFPDENQEKWWQKTAPLLKKVLQSIQYDVHQQYQYLTLYHSFIVPLLGPHPHTWDSFITYSGIPVEFSVNYQCNSPPTARIGWEPVRHISGTARDPYNQATVQDAVASLSRLGLNGFNSQLFTSFMQDLTVSERESEALQDTSLPMDRFKNQAAFGLDLKGGDVAVKGYIYPALKSFVTGTSFRELVEGSVDRMGGALKCRQELSVLDDFLEAAGLFNQYSFIGFDFTVPEKSRLKVYNTVQSVDFPLVEKIWTLDGRISHEATIQKGLASLKVLWTLLTHGVGKMAVGIFNHELGSGSMIPIPKWYLILHGQNDLDNAIAIEKFCSSLGWAALGDSFVDTVRSYFPGQDLSKTNHLIQYVSFAYSEKTGVYLSVYYHSSY